MFAIAEFPLPGGKSEIAIVHKSWIHGNKCFWPPFWRNNIQLTHALKQGHQPNSKTWSLHDARVVGNRFYASYDEARQRLPGAQINSELSVDENPSCRKRKRNRTTRFSDHETSDEEVANPAPRNIHRKPHNSKTPLTLPTPPSIPVTSPTETARPCLVAVADILDSENSAKELTMGYSPCQTEVSGQMIASSGSGIKFPTSSKSATVDNMFGFSDVEEFPNPNDNFSFPAQSQPNSTAQISSILPSTSSSICILTEDAAKTILTNQELIIAKLDILLDTQRTLLQGKKVRTETATTTFDLPLNSVENFTAMDRSLRENSKARDDLISLLETKGGNTPNQVIYRIMACLMTDELMMEFTFAGQTGKRSFKASAFLQCICDAVRNQPMGAALKDTDIEKGVDYWLKKASTRLAARQTKGKKVHQSSTSGSS